MKVATYNWKTSDGIDVFAKSWLPESGDIKGIITITHGLGEHIERYQHFAEVLTSAHYAILGYDQRGHGKTEGNRGHIPNYDIFLDDLSIAINKTKELLPKAPHFIYGHSMGGGLVANYLIRRQPKFQAAILSAPYFQLTNPQPPIKLTVGRWTQDLFPKLTLPNGLDPNHLSRDKEEVKNYINDPLVHNKISAKMGISIVDAGEYALEHASEINVPTLLLHGSGDQITSPKASQAFAEQSGGKVKIKLLPGLYHEIHNEPEKEEVLNTIVEWLDSHTK